MLAICSCVTHPRFPSFPASWVCAFVQGPRLCEPILPPAIPKPTARQLDARTLLQHLVVIGVDRVINAQAIVCRAIVMIVFGKLNSGPPCAWTSRGWRRRRHVVNRCLCTRIHIHSCPATKTCFSPMSQSNAAWCELQLHCVADCYWYLLPA